MLETDENIRIAGGKSRAASVDEHPQVARTHLGRSAAAGGQLRDATRPLLLAHRESLARAGSARSSRALESRPLDIECFGKGRKNRRYEPARG